MKKLLLLTAALLLICGVETARAGIQINTVTPWLDAVRVEPAAPAAGQDARVKATLSVEKSLTPDKILEAFLGCSTDGGKTWNDVEMEQSESNKKEWTGAVPGQPTGTEVTYYVRGTDTTGNVLTELPCEVSAWPPVDDPCMIPTARSLSMMEWPLPGVPEDMLLEEVRAGHDKEHLYFTMKVAGKVTPGTLSPFNMQSYSIIIFNVDSWQILDLFKEGRAFSYAPLLSAVGYPKTETRNGCVMAWKDKDKITFDAAQVDCAADGANLYFKIEKKSIGGIGPRTRFMAYLGTWNDFTAFLTADGVRSCDYTRYTLLRPGGHTYIVKE